MNFPPLFVKRGQGELSSPSASAPKSTSPFATLYAKKKKEPPVGAYRNTPSPAPAHSAGKNTSSLAKASTYAKATVDRTDDGPRPPSRDSGLRSLIKEGTGTESTSPQPSPIHRTSQPPALREGAGRKNLTPPRLGGDKGEGRSLRIFRTHPRRTLAIFASILILTFALVLFLSRHNTAAAAWWNDNWAYRKSVAVANSSGGTLSNYQVSVVFDTRSTNGGLISMNKMKADCSDVRITDASGTLLNYWIEKGTNQCDSQTTTIWTKVSSIGTSGTTLYVYYGNPAATDISDATQVFNFFDDFSGGAVDGGKWTTAGSPTVGSSLLNLTNGATVVSNSTQTDGSGLGRLIFSAKQSATNLADAKVGFTTTSSTGTHFNNDKAAMINMGSVEDQVNQFGGANLVSHYQLEETTSTDANQFKPSGYLDTGKLGQAVSMYGNAGGTTGSTLTYNRGLQISGNNYEHLNSNQGTVSFWIKPSWNGNDNLQHMMWIGSNTYGPKIYKDTGNYFQARYSANQVVSYSISSWTAGTWYQVVFAWDQDNTIDGTNYARVWINGTAVAGNTNSGTAPTLDAISYIGSANSIGSSPSNALIDDFSIYDRVLSTTEIASLYNAGSGNEAGYVADPSLKFYAKMDGSGTLQPVTYNGGASASKMTRASGELTGGTNILLNGNMEAAAGGAPTSWVLGGGATLADAESANIFADTRSQKISAVNAGDGMTQTISVVAGTNYSFSGWIKSDGTNPSGFMFYDLTNAAWITAANYSISSSWMNINESFKIPAGCTSLRLYVKSINTVTYAYYVDNLTLTPNLLDNGGMEGTYAGGVAPGWTVASATLTAESTTIHSGSESQKIVAAAQGQGVYQTISGLAVGQSYLVTGWFYVSSGFGKLFVTQGSSPFNTEFQQLTSGTGSWQKLSKIFQPTQTSVLFYLYSSSGAATFYVDDISVVPLDNVPLSLKSWTAVGDSASGSELLTNGGMEGSYGVCSSGGGTCPTSWDGGASGGTSHNGESSTAFLGSKSSSIFVSSKYGLVVGGGSNLVIGKGYNTKVQVRSDKPNTQVLAFDGNGGANNGLSTIYLTMPLANTWYPLSKFFNATSTNSGYYVENNTASSTVLVDEASTKESLNPLSVQGSTSGVTTTTGVFGNAYTFDGSTGYLRQKTYATNIGTLAYLGNDTTTAKFEDDGLDFSTYQTTSGSSAYMIVVTNSDNTVSWGYLGTASGAGNKDVDIYTTKARSVRGWGAPGSVLPIGGSKLAAGYEVRKTDFQLTGNLTIGAWINGSVISTDHVFVSKHGSSGSSGYYISDYGSSKARFFVSNDGTSYTQVYGNTTLSTGTWYFVVGVYDGSHLNIYVNGAADATPVSYSSGIVDIPIPMEIGASNGAANRFTGSIDSAFVISSALSASQILDLYNSTASHYGLTTNSSATAVTSPAITNQPNADATAYHTFTLNSQSASTIMSEDGTTIATSTTNLPNSAEYIRLQNVDPSNTLTVDWIAEASGASTAATTSVSAAEQNDRHEADAYWRMDEGYGQTINDSTQNGTTGTLGADASAAADDPTWQTEDMCVSGKCLKYRSASSQFVNVATAMTNIKSVTLWVKPTAFPTNLFTLNGAAGNAYLVTDGSGVFSAGAGFSSPTIYVNGKSTSQLTLNTWQQVTITTSSGISASNIMLGRGNSGYFDGWLDEVRVYATTRTQTQALKDTANRNVPSEGEVGVSLGGTGANTAALTDGLVGYWKMDDNVSGNNQTLTDASGSGFNGTTKYGANTSGMSCTGVGKYGLGCSFDGTDDYVDLPNLGITGSGKNQVTVSAWVNPAANQMNRVFTFGVDTVSMLLDSSGYARCYIRNSANTQGNNTSTATIPLNSWTFLICTYDGQTTRLFINGSQNITNQLTGDLRNNEGAVPGTGYSIGNGIQWPGLTYYEYFNGKLDDVRVYNRALSAQDVRTLYNFAPAPVGWWKFDENTGTTLYDSSGNNLATTMNNTPAWAVGKYGSALTFNGSSQSVTATLGADPAFSNTLEAWVFPTTSAASKIILTSSKLATNGSSQPTYGTCTGTALTLNAWTYLATVSNGSGSCQIYQNGVLTASNTTGVTFGTSVNIAASSFIGSMDDVRIYNYPRSAKQIYADLNAGHPAGGSPVGSELGFWTMEEGYSTTAHSIGTDTTLSGTLSGATTPTWTTSGKNGRALSFNGTTAYVTLGNSTSTRQTNAISLSGWVNLTTNNAAHDVIAKWKTSGATNYRSYRLYSSATGKLTMDVSSDGTAGNVKTIAGTTTLSTGTWYYVAGVYVPGTSLTLYVNGKQDGQNTSSISAAIYDSAANNNLEIGSEDGGTLQRMSGSLDDVKLYAFDLSKDEITIDANANTSMALGATGTTAAGLPDNSAAREYCVPGDATACTPPVGEWKFDEATAGTAYDTSGNGKNGTDTGVITSEVGKNGWGRNLASSASAANYVLMSGNANLRFTSASSFTYSAWIKATAYGGGGQYSKVMKQFSNSGGEFVYSMTAFDNGTPEIQVNVAKYPAAGNTVTFSSPAPTLNTWYYVTGVYTPSTISLYVNGQFAGSTSYAGGAASASTNSFTVLNDLVGSSPFVGTVDDVRVYNYVRTPAQIAQDMNKGQPLAYWNFDECTGSTLHDINNKAAYAGTWAGGTTVGTCSTAATAWYLGAGGKYNSSLAFNGSSDDVSVPDSFNLRFDAAAQDFSVFAWVKRAGNGAAYILSKEDADNDGWRLQFDAGDTVTCSVNGIDVTSTKTITDTNWHQIGCTIPRAGSGQVYIDANPDGSAVAISSTAMATTSALTIGTRSYSAANWFNGQIDDVRLYNYALTKTQVHTLYNNDSSVQFK